MTEKIAQLKAKNARRKDELVDIKAQLSIARDDNPAGSAFAGAFEVKNMTVNLLHKELAQKDAEINRLE
jgi:predicted RNase H-like nuclease (RuvC/YqgF family)